MNIYKGAELNIRHDHMSARRGAKQRPEGSAYRRDPGKRHGLIRAKGAGRINEA